MYKIAILASGSGTNAENIARIFNQGSQIRVELVITNRRNAGVIRRMEPLGVPVEYIPNTVWDNEPETVVETLRRKDIDLVVLAGFMHYVAPEIVEAYRGRIINVHPSLLPAYGGKGMYGHYVHEAVIAAGESESGVTVHYVTEETDGGEIILQERVEITPEDTAETLEAKIHPVEYSLYPRAIMKACGNLSASCTPPVKTQEEDWADALGIPPVPAAESSRGVESAVPPEVPAVSGVKVPPPPGASNASIAGKGVGEGEEGPAMPRTYMIWSVLATVLCCFIPGIVAILYSSKVSRLYYDGDTEGAKKASDRAQLWIIISFVLGVLSATLWLPMTFVTGL